MIWARSIVITAFHMAVFAVLTTITLGGIGAMGARLTASQGKLAYSPREPVPTAESSAAANTPTRSETFVVAVVLGSSATVATDAMGPYEVFARSTRFSVYTVAHQVGPSPVQGAPSILPDHTFADVDVHPKLAPDVVVVPAVEDPAGVLEQDTRDWVVRQHGRGARILSVCAGAMLMAETGLLEGHTATSHWSRLSSLRSDHQETEWVAGERFVRDGAITSTAGITSGIPGALSVVEDLAGADEARKVGAQVGYAGWSVDAPTTIPLQSWALSDWPVGLNTLLPWGRPTVGIMLRDGDSEIDVAALFEVYANSAAARTIAINETGVVRTAHGLTLLTLTETDSPNVDLRLRPGEPGTSGKAGFDGALEHLAVASGEANARAAAKMIDYPTGALDLGSRNTSPRTPLLASAAVVIAVLTGLTPLAIARSRHRGYR